MNKLPSPARGFLAAGLLLFGSYLRAEDVAQRAWNQDIIYFAVTDRFYDGDKSNDVPAGSDPKLYDPAQTNINLYQGGDFRGLELALQGNYFTDLGVTAIWITPPVRNVWYSAFDSNGPKTGYHGYWAQDFLDIDPHLVSRRSLDGKTEYPDTRDGRMQHYKDLVALAHSKGIKIIQDIVLNHTGPVFYYDANHNGKFDREERSEWIQPYNRDGHYDDAAWAETPEWDQHRGAPDGNVTILGHEVKTNGSFGKLESYGRKGMSPDSLGKSDGEEVMCDFFGLRDFWTAPGSAVFDKLVNDFVEVYAFYVETIGVDGFRIDTVKHVHHEFWDAFTERLRKRLGPERAKKLIMFGEIYDGDPVKDGNYTYRTDWPANPAPCLDSVLDFPFCYAARSYLRTPDRPYGNGHDLEAAMRALMPQAPTGGTRPDFNPTPDLDGLNAEQKVVNFIENHDGLNRFRVAGVSGRRNLLANALLLTFPGIPCLYYGTEAGLQDMSGKMGADSETGRMTYIKAGNIAQLEAVRESADFKSLAALCALRRSLPALTSGSTSPLWVDSPDSDKDDGVFAFARGDASGSGPAIVVINASEKESVTGIPGHAMRLVSASGQPLLARGDRLEMVPIAGFDTGHTGPIDVSWTDGVPEVELHVAPETIAVAVRARK